MSKITNQDFAAAKKAVKAVGTVDISLASKTAINILTERCPNASAELITDMAWQVVLASR